MKSILVLMAFPFSVALGAPNSESRSRWSIHEASSVKIVDHGAWRGFLSKYLDTSAQDRINRVRYGSVSNADSSGLEAYLRALQAEKVSVLNRDEQKAFWINLYNAATIAVVLRHHPVKSIRDIRLSKNPLKTGPWDATWLKVENVELSLNDIEHRILRPLWKDPRVHFALNCASLGCPNLAPVPYTVSNLEAMLEKGARNFLQSARGLEFKEKVLILSSIFDWYGEDFGKSRGEILEFLARYAPPGLGGRIKAFPGKIEHRYDWKLNEPGNGG